MNITNHAFLTATLINPSTAIMNNSMQVSLHMLELPAGKGH